MPIRPQLTRTERCPAMSSPGSHRPEPPEAGKTDTDAELPASLKAKRDVPSTAPYERVRSNSIAAGVIQRNLTIAGAKRKAARAGRDRCIDRFHLANKVLAGKMSQQQITGLEALIPNRPI